MTSFLSSPLGLTVSAKETFLGDFRGLNGGLVGDNPSDGPVLGVKTNGIVNRFDDLIVYQFSLF